MKKTEMQRRHFCYIAETLRDLERQLARTDYETVANHFADRLKSTNSGFSETRFLEACNAAGPIAEAYMTGRNEGHGLACHNVPQVGETYFTERDGRVTCDLDNAKELHETLCHEAAENARCFSPWEFVARDLNELPEGIRESAWESYELGVEDSIAEDLKRYDLRDYLDSDTLDKLECIVESHPKNPFRESA